MIGEHTAQSLRDLPLKEQWPAIVKAMAPNGVLVTDTESQAMTQRALQLCTADDIATLIYIAMCGGVGAAMSGKITPTQLGDMATDLLAQFVAADRGVILHG